MIRFIFHFLPLPHCLCHSAYAEGRGRLAGVSPFLSSCRPQGLNSGHQAWHQAPLPTESSHSPFLFVFKVNNVSYSGSALSNVNLIPSICLLQRWQRQVDLLRAFMVWDCGAGFGGGMADRNRIEGNQQQDVHTHTCRMWSLIPESFSPRFHKLDRRGKDGLLQIWG